MSELKPLPCPQKHCWCDRITVWKARGGRGLRRVRYFAECDNCHYCGPSKRFKRSAIKAWNRRVGEGEKDGV